LKRPNLPRDAPARAERRQMPTLVKTALDMGPLLVFFITFFVFGHGSSHEGLIRATGAFMAATLVSLATTYALVRRIPVMPLITGIVVMVFGGLTIVFKDERFIKMKPTIVYVTFAVALFGGLRFNKLFIRHLLGSVFQLTDAGWRALTIRWGVFFVLAAILNEVIWRNFSTEFWITFKVWGFMALTFVFTLWQVAFVSRYQTQPETEEDASSEREPEKQSARKVS
jgi:intracellular septation protein